MIVVVSDTSPIRALNHLGMVHLLQELYGHILVPPGVQSELLSPPRQLQAVDLAEYDFIEVRRPTDTAQIEGFQQHLDIGESEAIALALEIGADAVLIDEEDGRKIAAEHGFEIIGTLGILLRAKARGHLTEVRSSVTRLKTEFGFFVSSQLESHVLRLPGED